MQIVALLGLTIHSSTYTNKLQLDIPDELKGIDLQIIIIPADKSSIQEIEFFTDAELKQLAEVNSGTPIRDDEDYTKW